MLFKLKYEAANYQAFDSNAPQSDTPYNACGFYK